MKTSMQQNSNMSTAIMVLFSVSFVATLFNFSTITALRTLALLLIYLIKTSKQKNQDTQAITQLPLPPGPKAWPIVGSIPTLLNNKPFSRWIHNFMQQNHTEIACIRLANVHVIAVTSPKIGREFLKAQDANFAIRPMTMASRLASKGYLATAVTPGGDQWKKMKRVLVAEVLSPARHNWFHEKRAAEADHLVRYVYNKSNEDGLVDVRLAARQYCGNVVRKMAFNKRFFGQGKKNGGPGIEEEEHVDSLFRIHDFLFSFRLSDYVPCLEGFDFDGHQQSLTEANEKIDKYHDPIIDDRIQQWKNGAKTEAEDLLDIFINLKDENGNALLSLDEIRAQITDIMLAAIDNPSHAVEWAIAEMINHPELLEKAREELDRVVGKDRLVQESDLSELNFIKACAREAFRLHPVAPFNIPHVAIADTTVADYFIPKDSHILLSRIGLGRNPHVWDEPNKFKPERHIKNDGSKLALTEPDLRFLSFSTGRRGCIGINLGTSMTLMLFARLLHGFTWDTPANRTAEELLECVDLKLVKPVVAVAKPRLHENVYDQIMQAN